MDVAFQLLSIPLFFLSFIKLFILSFCLNNMIYYFLQHVSYFICASSLNLLDLYALCHVLCLDLQLSCLYVQIYILRVFMPCFLCFVPLFALRCCQGYVLTRLIPCPRLCFAWIYVLVCFLPCFMLRSTSIHVYMLGFTFFHVYVLVFTCSHRRCHAYAQIFVFTCLRARIQVFTCLYVQIYVLSCLCAWIHVLCALCNLPCASALHAMIVCLDLGYVYLGMCYCSYFVTLPFFLVFWPIGLDPIQTLWSLSSFIYLSPYQRVWITRFACLCLLASMLYACVSLSCSKLVVGWLHSTPRRPCLDVTIWGCIVMIPIVSCIPFPLFHPVR